MWIMAETASEKVIADTLAYVSGCRSDLEATQNRRECVYRGNLNTEENTTAAESSQGVLSLLG